MELTYEFPLSQGSQSLMPVARCPNEIASYSPLPRFYCLQQGGYSGHYFSILEPEMEVGGYASSL